MGDTLKKAIDGLRFCANSDSCSRCPYRNEGDAEKEILCADKLMLDALRMLEAFRSRIKEDEKNAAPKKAKQHKNHKPVRAVLMMDLEGIVIKRFESATDAAKQIGKNADQIRKACRGGSNTAGGYRWRYEEEYDGLD